VKVDATSPTPKTARTVRLGRELVSREGLETAWLLLQEHSDRRQAIAGMREQGWDIPQAVEFVSLAERWTGNVVSSVA